MMKETQLARFLEFRLNLELKNYNMNFSDLVVVLMVGIPRVS